MTNLSRQFVKASIVLLLLVSLSYSVSGMDAMDTGQIDTWDSGWINGEQPIRIYIEGTEVLFEVPPLEVDGRTLVPMRAIFEKLEADITWDHATQTVRAVKDETEIMIVRDSKTAWVNGQAFALDVSARTVNSRMMVPIRFVSEALHVGVQWTESERRIDLFANSEGHAGQGTEENLQEELKLTYPERLGAYKLVSGRLSFGEAAPRGISFATKDLFVDTLPDIYYQIVLEFDEKWENTFPSEGDTILIDIQTNVWGPDQALILSREEVRSEIRSNAKEFRTHNTLRLAEIKEELVNENGRWKHGVYRVEIIVNDKELFVEDFSIVASINTVGNTASNLYNRGLVAQQGDLIYYVGPDGGLYKKTIQGKEIAKLSSDQTEYLNTKGEWIYFVNRTKDDVISRIRFDGKTNTSDYYPYYSFRGETETLSHNASGQLLLVGDWLYYVNLSDKRRLYRMGLDGSDNQLVIDQPIEQFYAHNQQIIFMTHEQTFSQWSGYDKNDKDQNEREKRLKGTESLSVGYLYIASIDGRNQKRIVDDAVIGMVVANHSIYYLTPMRNANWGAQISGRVPGNLYKTAIPVSNGSLTARELIADEVMNFHVDSDWLLLQTNPNRGGLLQRYTIDGEFIDELTTQVTRKQNVSTGRTTFPVTYLNRAYDWIYYYVGDENERVTDSIPVRNDRYRSITENSTRELLEIEDNYYW